MNELKRLEVRRMDADLSGDNLVLTFHAPDIGQLVVMVPRSGFELLYERMTELRQQSRH